MHDLVTALEDDHEIRRSVVEQVMGWFGVVSDGRWKMDVGATVKEVGLGILRAFKVCFAPAYYTGNPLTSRLE